MARTHTRKDDIIIARHPIRISYTHALQHPSPMGRGRAGGMTAVRGGEGKERFLQGAPPGARLPSNSKVKRVKGMLSSFGIIHFSPLPHPISLVTCANVIYHAQQNRGSRWKLNHCGGGFFFLPVKPSIPRKRKAHVVGWAHTFLKRQEKHTHTRTHTNEKKWDTQPTPENSPNWVRGGLWQRS